MNLSRKLKALKKRLQQRFGVEKMLLFGSRARRDHLERSDIDVVVVSNGFRGVPFPKRLSDVSELWLDVPSLEALCYTPEEFEKLKKQSYVLKAAVREGIPI